ncbi:haloacid dehalogenase-like hydrolase [Nocardia sp. NPDC004151]|uniref:haloacid dehalogenase-like hydrolase n=1 Tax=Nocardia sp. NPDC004151 TaxID=3364304 RepID=UPI0036A13E01
MKTRSLVGLIAAAGALLSLTACGSESDGAAATTCKQLDSGQAWYGANKDTLSTFIATTGTCGKQVDSKPLALFDWDNTLVKNDAGEATFYWLLSHDKVLQPSDWSATSPYLTAAASAALRAACGTAASGTPLPTSTNPSCADEILAIGDGGKTKVGAPAFDGYDHRRLEPAYAWQVQLLAGHTPAELTDYATQARAQNLAAPEGTEQTIGTTKVDGWVRYYSQQRDLVTTLQANGFDVRIITASAEPVIKVWSPELGVPADKVIGIVPLTDQGTYTGHIAGCGGLGPDQVITYMEGKRCAINERIFGITGPTAFDQQPPDKRPALAAGDSDTDVVFVSDATALHLVINRNKTELMCQAYANTDGKWLINPMFINPKKHKDQPYPCATAGFTTATGAHQPLTQPSGTVIPDQQDGVY